MHAEDLYVSKHAQQITASDNIDVEKRFKLIEQKVENIPEGDFQLYLNFLQRAPTQDSVTEDDLATLKNEVADKLILCERGISKLSALFIKQVDDVTQGHIWQNYVLQKLAPLYLKCQNQSLKEDLLKKLQMEALNKYRLNSGTALLGIHFIYKRSGELKELLEKLVMKVVFSDEFVVTNREIALEIAVRLRNPKALEIARSWLKIENLPVSSRATALACLGIGQFKEDLTMVEQFLNSRDFRIRSAAKHAYQLIEEK